MSRRRRWGGVRGAGESTCVVSTCRQSYFPKILQTFSFFNIHLITLSGFSPLIHFPRGRGGDRIYLEQVFSYSTIHTKLNKKKKENLLFFLCIKIRTKLIPALCDLPQLPPCCVAPLSSSFLACLLCRASNPDPLPSLAFSLSARSLCIALMIFSI